MNTESAIAPALACHGVSVGYRLAAGTLSVVRDASLSIAPGAALGIVGESGSGKSTLALALAGCLPPGGVVTGGRIAIAGQEVSPSAAGQRRELAKRLSVVFQNPGAALDPGRRIGSVFRERLRLLGHPREERPGRAAALLDSVRIRNIDEVLRSYPHQLSGGMQQRVVIALALANDPAVLIMDEPTTGLDATVAGEIVELLGALRRDRSAALIFVSHDIGQVHQLCDDIAVMYGGELVEVGPADDIIARPRHPYTMALLGCLPSVNERRALAGIKGAPPSPSQLLDVAGCLFAARCERVTQTCTQQRPPAIGNHGHVFRCFHPLLDEARTQTAAVPRSQSASDDAVRLKVQGLSMSYGQGSQRRLILDDVNFQLCPGEILAVVGESGSGKSTLLKGLLGLVPPDSGTVEMNGDLLPNAFAGRGIKTLADMRVVFQNPSSALNRRRKIGAQIGRSLSVATGRRATPDDQRAQADKVRLPHYNLGNYAKNLSGGLLQRVAIACALAGEPQVILFDEPTSALDVSVQADILNLISEQIRHTRAAAVFVTHDLAVVRQIADRALVLLHGKVVESGPVEDILERPQHAYTQRLLAAFSAKGEKRADAGRVVV